MTTGQSNGITVKVVSVGRKCLSMYFVDAITGKRVTRSTGATRRREAERIAAKWEEQLRNGDWAPEHEITWDDFRDRYEEEVYPGLKPKTREARDCVFRHVERHINPHKLSAMTPQTLGTLQTKFRRAGMSEATISAHCGHLRAALNWAHTQGYLRQPCKMKLKASTRRSRPVTTEEYERLIMSTPKVRPHDAGRWTRYIEGLWLSGLRLGESLQLSWDTDTPLHIDASGRHVRFYIDGSVQKSGQDQLLPITPDFAAFLLATPEAERHGLVFPLMGDGKQMTQKRVSRVLSAIGRRANVNVSEKPREVKWASAHDLRRSFGTRWAPHVKPATLMTLMRHANVSTTMRYYVTLDCDDVADQLATVHQHFFNTSPPMGGNQEKEQSHNPVL